MNSKIRDEYAIIPGKTWLVNIILLVNDCIGFILAIGLVTLVRRWFLPIKGDSLFDPQVMRTIFTLISFSLIIFFFKGLYPGRGRISVIEMKQVIEAIVVAYAIAGVLIFIRGNNASFSRSVFLLSSVFAAGMISIGRFLSRKLISHFPWWGEPVVIIGYASEITQVIKKLESCPRLGYRPAIALAVDIKREKNVRDTLVLPWSKKRQKEIQKLNIHTNILAISTSELRQKYPEVYNAIGTSYHKTIFIMDDDVYGTMMAESMDMNGQPALVSKQVLLNPVMRISKELFELFVIVLAFLPFLLVYSLIALLIKLDSKGPVLYTQERVGQYGKPFQVYKFRTMVANSEQVLQELLQDPKIKREWEKYHKITNDPRITRAGKWVRKFSLDELPQFFNILRGEMSLIGPRPLVKEEIDQLGDLAEVVLQVKPGLSGWWQVNGRNNLSFEERTSLDLYYIYNWSLWLDLFIFIKTFWVLLVDRGK
jgi:Undecaprenyl-phosphate galactose phosphotransferase WbaP